MATLQYECLHLSFFTFFSNNVNSMMIEIMLIFSSLSFWYVIYVLAHHGGINKYLNIEERIKEEIQEKAKTSENCSNKKWP